MKRFTTLDMLRGVAAFAVMIFHFHPVGIFPHGYLAVDFFFILSGFVVGHAYEAKLEQGFSFGEFFIVRMIRLYPLAALGTLGGGAILLAENSFVPNGWNISPISDILASLSFNLFMLPSPLVTKPPFELFLCDGVEWSLFFEIAANLIWAALIMRVRTGRLIAFVIVSGLALFATDHFFSSGHVGWNTLTWWGGVPRVGFGFAMGLLIYRLRWHERLPVIRFGGFFVAVALLAVLAFPAGHGILWDLLAVLLILPILVLAGAAQTAAGRLSVLLGELSYPLYILHWHLLRLVWDVNQSVAKHIKYDVLAGCAIPLAILVSYAALRFFDEPVRRWLTQQARSVKALKQPVPKQMDGLEQQSP